MRPAEDRAGVAWWLVEEGPLPPAGNMAMDEALLREAIGRRCPGPLLRIYGWDPPALSVGATLPAPVEVSRRCAETGVTMVQRVTGGGCVLHDGDVTYCVVAPQAGRGVLEAYRWVAEGLIAAFALLGIPASVAERPAGTGARPAERPLDCFQWATGADLQVEGRKICGSAQVRRQGWFLQHGSIPVRDVRARTARLLGASVCDERSTCLERIRPGTSWAEMRDALVQGFRAAWGPASPARTCPLRDPLGMV